MSNTRFTAGNAVRFGWDVTKKHIGFFIGILVVYWVVLGILYVPALWALNENSMVLYWLFYIVFLLASLLLGMGLMRIVLKLHDGQEATFNDLINNWQLLGKYIGVTILQTLLIYIGFFLLVVPGVIFALMFAFAGYYVLDKGMGPIEAMKASKEATKGYKLDLFGLFVILGLMNVIGALLFGIGLFATIPTTLVAMVYVYRKLSEAGASATPMQAQMGANTTPPATSTPETTTASDSTTPTPMA